MIPARINGLFSVNREVSVARGWYEGLGWVTERTDHVFVPFPLAATSFALWSAASAASSVNAVIDATGTFSGELLSLVVNEEKEVDALLEEVTEAGGRVVMSPGVRAFGRAGWWIDPFGVTWEISWINGHGADDAFDGSAVDTAIGTSLAAVTLYGKDPVASMEFYAKALGWSDLLTTWTGRPALALEGALLAFADADDVHPIGECGALMVNTASDVDTLHFSLVGAGAGSLSEPQSLAVGCRTSTIQDPNGVIWDLVYDPEWTSTPDGPVCAK